MVRRYNPFTFSALSLVPFFTQGCVPPFPDALFIENASITAAETSDTGDTAEELTLDSLLTVSAHFVTNSQLFAEEDGFTYAVRLNVDELGEEEIFIQDDFSALDYGYSALFSRDYPADYFGQGEHTAVLQGSLYYVDRESTYYGQTLYTPKVEVPFTITDNDEEVPLISDITATPQYAGNDTTILLEATVTDNKWLDTVVASLLDSSYTMTDSDGDSVYSATIDPSTFSLTATIEYTEFSFTVAATDTNENTATSDPVLFYVSDAIAPEVADAGTSTETDNSPLTTWSVYATATDLGTGVESVSVELNENGVLLPMTYQGSDVYSIDVSGDQLSAPSTTYTLHAFDYAGLESTTTATVSVENITGITINDLVLSPSTVSNASSEYVTITLDAEDLQDAESDLLAYCTVDTLPVTLAYQSGTQFIGTFDTSSFIVAQDYTVSCTVEDTDGYTANRSAALTVTDGLVPDVSCSATNAANDGSSSIDISCTVDDETGLASSPVTYSSSLGSGSLTNSSGSTYEASISVTGVAAASYTIDVLAADAAGNTQSYTVTPTVTDAIAPTYTNLSASPSSLSNDGSSSFVVSATNVYDETTIADISVTVDGTAYTMTDADGDSIYETAAITPTSWPATSYTIDLVISDGTNETTGSTVVDITDAVGPTVSSCSSSIAANDGSIDSTFSVNATDETGVSAVSYNTSFGSGSLSLSSGSTYSATVDVTDIAAGSYSVAFTAIDTTGNTSSSCNSTLTINDEKAPAITCTLTASSVSNAGDSTTLDCVVSEETGMSSVTYSGLGSGSMSGGSGSYSNTFTVGSSRAAGSYTITAIATDTSGNTDSDSVTLTVTDGTAPTFTSVYATPDSVLDDGTQSFEVYVCVDDETDGAQLDGSGGIDVVIDSLTETLSYDSSSTCYISREIGGDELGAGTYTLSATATDAAGNSSTDTSASLEVTCSAITVVNVTASESAIYNNNIPSDYTISADITAGSCAGTIDTSSLEVTINGTTKSMSLSSGSTYVSGTFDAYAMDLGTYTVSVTGADTAGNTTTNTDETITVADICDNLATDAVGATVGLYQGGSFQTSLSTAIPSKMATFDTLNLGAYGSAFNTSIIVNYDGALGELFSADTSSCSGGSVSGSSYVTSSYHDCSLTGTYDGTTYPTSVSVYYAGGGVPALAMNSSSVGGTGTDWFHNSSTNLIGIDDGNGNRAYAGVAAGGYITLCLNP